MSDEIAKRRVQTGALIESHKEPDLQVSDILIGRTRSNVLSLFDVPGYESDNSFAGLSLERKESIKKSQEGSLFQRTGDDFVIAFPALIIEPGQTTRFTTIPTIAFKPSRIIIPSNIADHFEISDILVGPFSQVALTQAVPATAFTEISASFRLALDTCHPGLALSIDIRNIDSQPQRFQGVALGSKVE